MWIISVAYHACYWFFTVTLQWLVAVRTDNDPVALGVIYFVTLSPLLLVSLPAGVLLDRFEVRRSMTWVQGLLVVLALLTVAATLFGFDNYWVLLLLSGLLGVSITVSNPAAAALAAFAVPREDLSSAVPLQALAMNVARTVGPALAGILIARWGPVSPLVLSAAAATVALVLAAGLPLERHVQAGPRDERPLSLRSGLQHAHARPPALLAVTLVALAMIFGASYLAQLPAIAAMTSGSDVAFILLTTIGGLGSLTGVLWVAIRGGTSPNLRLAFLGCLALGSAVVMLALVRSMPLAVVALFIAGASQFLATTVSQYVIQAAVDDHYRGRVLSLFYWAWGGMMPVGGLLLGVLMALLGVSTALVLTGLATILGSAGLWWVYRREGPKTRRVKPS